MEHHEDNTSTTTRMHAEKSAQKLINDWAKGAAYLAQRFKCPSCNNLGCEVSRVLGQIECLHCDYSAWLATHVAVKSRRPSAKSASFKAPVIHDPERDPRLLDVFYFAFNRAFTQVRAWYHPAKEQCAEEYKYKALDVSLGQLIPGVEDSNTPVHRLMFDLTRAEHPALRLISGDTSTPRTFELPGVHIPEGITDRQRCICKYGAVERPREVYDPNSWEWVQRRHEKNKKDEARAARKSRLAAAAASDLEEATSQKSVADGTHTSTAY
ncbi:hypothetical protein [Corynebacterium aquilae]|uniref:Uncharacterized protein n=1 Tax=Corynebacterium aquilae DSM 44791 TaxID=1431546 RepID=A0A1L7CHU0_9CORY|nr:hypothetical protein [Corynebacterium aquilae]APT85420.1 hypothetical protein CAQU_10590 [Corynebacterium aquilae DSM 44791]